MARGLRCDRHSRRFSNFIIASVSGVAGVLRNFRHRTALSRTIWQRIDSIRKQGMPA
jgi:hypothetical protein